MNPCIDCHLLMLRRAAVWLDQGRADFVATGEVAGQRVMSQQTNMLRHIEKAAGLTGLLLRPLSARLLAPTIPEQQGWVDRDALLTFHGRSRRPQEELARSLGITGYRQPAGGCCLTEPVFSRRLKDLLKHQEAVPELFYLLRLGRHFRLPGGGKVIVARNQAECEILLQNQPGDIWRLSTAPRPGPVAWCWREEDLPRAAALVARYANRARALAAPGVLEINAQVVSGAQRTMPAEVLPEGVIDLWRL